MAIGLRERRKQEARQAISGAAMALFEARGFDEVTISQVADEAGVSKMTVTNYFPRKEDLVFDRAEVTIRSLADAAAARAPGESLLAAVRRDYTERIAGADDPQQRIVAAQLASVHRVLFAEGTRRVLAGQPRDEICQVLAAAAGRAFDLLEPSLGGYGCRC